MEEEIKAAFVRLSGGRPMRLMEVCGSHSAAIARCGIRSLLPGNIRLLSGPGCPVCVSRAGLIGEAAELSSRGIRLAVFGDLAKVPGPGGIRLEGKPNVTAVYSPDEALQIAEKEDVVFVAAGFEPTEAACAALLQEADERDLNHFSMLCDFKNILPVFSMLPGVDGFLLPGHVAAITGRRVFDRIGKPGVIAGFEAEDLVMSLLHLVSRVSSGDRSAANDYPRVVPEEPGSAMELVDTCFEVCGALWRGIGEIPSGGRRIAKKFERFDAVKKYGITAFPEVAESSGCCCGAVLRGELAPEKCPLFGKACTPDSPEGACMVSVEGACHSAFIHREI